MTAMTNGKIGAAILQLLFAIFLILYGFLLWLEDEKEKRKRR